MALTTSIGIIDKHLLLIGGEMSRLSYVLASDPAIDLTILAAMARELEDYIVGDELYRTLIVRTSSGDQRLQMTGGDMLSRLYRVEGAQEQLSDTQRQQFVTVASQIEETIRSLQTRFHERLVLEMKNRLNGLAWFLDDCADDPQRCRVEFPFEMRNRQRIEEILKRAKHLVDDQIMGKLRSVDQRIRHMTHATDFIWDEQLETLFPRAPYWYLYVLP